MTKPQLIEAVAAQTEKSKAAVEAVIQKIGDGLESGERVDIRAFGSFVVKERKARQGRNPKTGETLTIAAKKDAGFKPGKELTHREMLPSWWSSRTLLAGVTEASVGSKNSI